MKLGPEEAVREVKRLLAQLGPLYTIRRGRVCPRDPHLHAYLRFSHHGTSTPSVPRIDPKPGHAALAAVAIPLASLTAAATAAVHRTAGVVHPLVPASQAVGRLLSARDAEACKAAAAAAVADPWVTTCTDDDRRAAESYAVRHVVQHLVAVANDCSGSSAAAAVVARGLLDGLLCDFDFLAAVFRSGRGRALVRELSALEAPLSEVVQDAVRWLLSCYRELCFASEAADVVATGLRCPMGTLAFRRAEGWALARAAAAGRRGWRLRHGLGALHGWPAVRLTLAVSVGGAGRAGEGQGQGRGQCFDLPGRLGSVKRLCIMASRAGCEQKCLFPLQVLWRRRCPQASPYRFAFCAVFCRATAGPSTVWRGALTAAAWPPPATTPPCGCGTRSQGSAQGRCRWGHATGGLQFSYWSYPHPMEPPSLTASRHSCTVKWRVTDGMQRECSSKTGEVVRERKGGQVVRMDVHFQDCMCSNDAPA